MEPFCVILKRALASKHPLHQILKYHCRDITIPNSLGTPKLIDEGKFVDQLFAFGNNGTARLLKDGYQVARWKVTDFRGEIKVRGWVISNNSPCFGTWPWTHLPPPPLSPWLCALAVILAPSFWIFWIRPWLSLAVVAKVWTQRLELVVTWRSQCWKVHTVAHYNSPARDTIRI